MAICNENDMRKWLRGLFRPGDIRAPRWIEPAPGSTPGLPDCFVPIDGAIFWIELKFGKVINDQLRIRLTAEQEREFPRLLEAGQTLLFLIGGRRPGQLWLARADEPLLQGYVTGGDFMTDTINADEFINAVRFAAKTY